MNGTASHSAFSRAPTSLRACCLSHPFSCLSQRTQQARWICMIRTMYASLSQPSKVYIKSSILYIIKTGVHTVGVQFSSQQLATDSRLTLPSSQQAASQCPYIYMRTRRQWLVAVKKKKVTLIMAVHEVCRMNGGGAW